MQSEINNGNGNNDNKGNTDNKCNNDNLNGTKARVLRFEFSSALIERLNGFVNVHEYDDRKTYKEAWMAWLAHDEIAALLTTEVARLRDLGYKGDVLDKLFKSGRYYFRTREPMVPNTQPRLGTAERLGQAPPRKYVLLNSEVLDAMDEHIERGLRSNDAYTPASGFVDFCNMRTDDAVLKAEVVSLSERLSSGEAVHAKLKKTYKNRYFMLNKAYSIYFSNPCLYFV